MTRINLNLDNDLLKRIDNYAKKRGINRTAAISVLCGEYLEQKETVEIMGKAVDLIGKEEK